MEEKTKRAFKYGAKAIVALALVGSLAGKYGTKITNSYMSGANQFADNMSGYKSKNIVAENASKIVGKTFDATAKFLQNVKNRIGR